MIVQTEFPEVEYGEVLHLMLFCAGGALRDGDAGGCVRLSVRSLFGAFSAAHGPRVRSLFG